jgi:GNAT superfamily N-acetyltransferase
MVKYELILPGDFSNESVIDDIADINRLVAQLTGSASRWFGTRTLEAVCLHSELMVGRNSQGRIVGMGTMARVYTLTGTIAYLHDVVVDASVRRQGIGEELVSRLERYMVTRFELDRVEFTCKPTREDADRMYLRLSYQRRETNNYIKRL